MANMTCLNLYQHLDREWTIPELCIEYELTKPCLYSRIARYPKKPIGELLHPMGNENGVRMYKYQGKQYTLQKLWDMAESELSRSGFYRRLKKYGVAKVMAEQPRVLVKSLREESNEKVKVPEHIMLWDNYEEDMEISNIISARREQGWSEDKIFNLYRRKAA